MIKIADLFKEFSSTYTDKPDTPPIIAGTLALKAAGYDPLKIPILVNIATAYVIWRRAKERTIWRVSEHTAGYLSDVGLGFIPETPPVSWSDNAICIEAAGNHNLFGDVFSVCGYKTLAPTTQTERYYFVFLRRPDGVGVFSVEARSGNISADSLLDMPMLRENHKLDTSADLEHIALPCLQFVFALSYYALNPERTEITDAGGPIERNAKGKPVKRNGRTIPIWRYRNLTVRASDNAAAGERGPLDKDGLELKPVLVRPYIRRHGVKVIIVDSHESHRWKRTEEPEGVKVKV